MDIHFWAEAHKRAKQLLREVSTMEALAQEGKMSELGLCFDRLRVPCIEFKQHCAQRRLGFVSQDVNSLFYGAASLKISFEGWEMFAFMARYGIIDPIAFIGIWRDSLRVMVDLLLDKCKSETVHSN